MSMNLLDNRLENDSDLQGTQINANQYCATTNRIPYENVSGLDSKLSGTVVNNPSINHPEYKIVQNAVSYLDINKSESN